MNFGINKKIALYAASTVALIILGERFFLSDFRERLTTLRQQIRLEEATLKKNLRIQKTKDSITQEYTLCKPFLQLSSSSNEEIVAQLLAEVENIIRASGGTVVNLSPERESQAESSYKKYRVTVRFEVTFKQLIAFLHSVSESNLLIKLDKLSVGTKSESSEMLRADGIVSIAIPR